MIRDRGFLGRRARTFTLQWHLTNACPFHCRHCYDRSDRGSLSYPEALAVLSDLRSFCAKRRVRPNVSLSGGDPMLFHGFWDLYRAIAEADIPAAILGNPVSADTLDRLLAIRAPTFYQVSLEGLRAHNDEIRGGGHYEKTVAFLKETRARGVTTHVMLTLTRANLAQFLPLAAELRGLTSRLAFNRLAQVGEGTDLPLPDRDAYAAFLTRCLAARRENPVIGFKDNLFNIVRHRHGRRVFPGCTGHGCGAAFNFVALMPDGEVHACRKFPSLLGNIRGRGLGELYDSPAARRYREGSAACRGCRLRNRCGGCMAVTHGQGLDPLQARDPFCFLDSDGRRRAAQSHVAMSAAGLRREAGRRTAAVSRA
jgi:selenobiotic family peptide radical SAM maturase